MEKIIRLQRKIEKAKDERMHVQNLETVVKDLSSTSFNRDVRLCGRPYYFISQYNIDYGTNTRKNKSGVLIEERVEKREVIIDTLRQLRRHIRKAKRTENPYFRVISKNVYQEYHNRIERIDLREIDSSTSVTARLDDFYDKAEVQFNYDSGSSKREILRIERSVSRLLKRGYEKVFIET